jgi:hypothetical protein
VSALARTMKGGVMARPGDVIEAHGGLFGAPHDGDGTAQSAVDADLIITPGGLMLVEQSSPLSSVAFFRCDISGDITCENGRD